jgi:hypothetical protein
MPNIPYSTPIKGKYKGPSQDLINNYRIFPSDYFTGCDTAILFGDTFIDEIVNLQFSIQEQVLPLYGYADYRFRSIAHGNRIVTGSFTINFKEAGYIFLILERMRSLGTLDRNNQTRENWSMKDVEQLYKEWLEREAKSHAPNNQELASGAADAFETIADYYERAHWGDKDTNYQPFIYKDQNGKVIQNYSGKQDGQLWMNFVNDFRARRTNPYFDVPFTITVSYGDNAAAFAARQDGVYQEIYGSKYGPGKTQLPIEETVKTINGVHIFSAQQVMDLSGHPTQEVYQFMAQDVDNFDDIIRPN